MSKRVINFSDLMMSGKIEQNSDVKQKGILKKRLFIFVIATFILTWVPTFLFLGLGGKYDVNSPSTSLLCTFSMLCPACGAIITRFITKEGFALTGKDSFCLGASFQNKKWIWFVAAFLFPYIYWTISDGIWFLFQPQTFDTSILKASGFTGADVLLIPVLGIVSAVTISFGALGEEIGWRSYLYPKLEELFGLKMSLLIGGIIWGVWHWPLVAVGHIGTGYFGEPYTGFLVFTLDCIFEGCILYMLTKKSGSIWPAVFLHAFNNAGADILGLCRNEEKATGIFQDQFVNLCILLIGTIVVSVVSYIILSKNKKIVENGR